MKKIELVRWGVPTVAFLVYFKWGGLALSLVLFGILFAVISGFIHWHQKDPHGFHKGIRVWIVLLLLIPSLLFTLGALLTVPLLAPLPLIAVGVSVWLLVRSNRQIRRHDISANPH